MDIGGILTGVILVFTRIMSFLYIIPLFQSRSVPAIVKSAIAISIAIFIHDEVNWQAIDTLPKFIIMLLMQISLGVALGFVVNMIFSIPRIAGSLLDIDMGFSSSSIIDPNNGQRVSLIASFYNTLFMLIFVMLGGIENLIYGIVLSFHFTEAVFFIGNINFIETLFMAFNYMMVSSIQIALPIIATMFIVNFMMLILGKIAPQLNILVNMFPIKIAVGLIFVYFSVTVTGEFFAQVIENLNEHYLDVLESMYMK